MILFFHFKGLDENHPETNPDDLLTTYMGNIWVYSVVAGLDAFIRAFVSVELFMSLINYKKMMKIQGIDKSQFYRTRIKDLLPVLFGGVIAMISTCLILSDVSLTAYRELHNSDSIKPLPIFLTYFFEILGTNLMIGSIFWSYHSNVKNFLEDCERDLEKQR